MYIEPVVRNGEKLYHDSRGGFTAIARFAKCQAVSLFKNNLYNSQNWCIALSRPSTPAEKTIPKIYTTTYVTKKLFYHVVTRGDKADNSNDNSKKNKCDIDALVYIDYDSIAKSMNINSKDLKKSIANNSYYKEIISDVEAQENEMINSFGDEIDEAIRNRDNSLTMEIVTGVIEEINNIPDPGTLITTTDNTTTPTSCLPLPTTTICTTTTPLPTITIGKSTTNNTTTLILPTSSPANTTTTTTIIAATTPPETPTITINTPPSPQKNNTMVSLLLRIL
jgi:hypothetical protein